MATNWTLNTRQGRVVGEVYTATVGDTEYTDALKIPPGFLPTLTVIPGANTGKFQHTSSPDADVTGGTATWIDWNSGDVTENTSDAILSQVTAVRGYASGGNVDFEVVL